MPPPQRPASPAKCQTLAKRLSFTAHFSSVEFSGTVNGKETPQIYGQEEKELEEARKGAHLLAFGKYQQTDGFDQQFPAPNTETETVFGNDF